MGLAAGVALVVGATMIMLGNPARPTTAIGRDACQKWIEQTLTTVEKLPMLRRRDGIVNSLPRACAAFPAVLRSASSRASGAGKGQPRDRMLATASREVLGSPCVVPPEASTGFQVSKGCPLVRPEFGLAEQALKDMSAPDYLLLNAMLKSLADAHMHTETAEMLMRNFSLSAALLGEQTRESSQRK